jgi:hypothetical protein
MEYCCAGYAPRLYSDKYKGDGALACECLDEGNPIQSKATVLGMMPTFQARLSRHPLIIFRKTKKRRLASVSRITMLNLRKHIAKRDANNPTVIGMI